MNTNKRKKEPNNKGVRGAKKKRNSFKDEPIHFGHYTETSEPFDMEFLEPAITPPPAGEESDTDDSTTDSMSSTVVDEPPLINNPTTAPINKPINRPTTVSANIPMERPTAIPINRPSAMPINRPSIAPQSKPVAMPTNANLPTNIPTTSEHANSVNSNHNLPGQQSPPASLQVEKSILTDMKSVISDSKLRQDEITKITHKYYGAYFLKTVKEMDVFKDIIDEEAIGNDFYKAFVYAKTAINCNMQITKYNALASAMRVVFNLVSQAVHNHVVVNVLGRCVDSESLQNAFVEFQAVFMKESEVDKNQCISYIIQQEIDNNKPIRVPHPLVSCTTAQILGISKYLTVILTSVAKGYIKR